jgi:hypothetical protein
MVGEENKIWLGNCGEDDTVQTDDPGRISTASFRVSYSAERQLTSAGQVFVVQASSSRTLQCITPCPTPHELEC